MTPGPPEQTTPPAPPAPGAPTLGRAEDPVDRLRRLGDELAARPPLAPTPIVKLAARRLSASTDDAFDTGDRDAGSDAPADSGRDRGRGRGHDSSDRDGGHGPVEGDRSAWSGPADDHGLPDVDAPRRRRLGTWALAAALVVVLGLVSTSFLGQSASSKFSSVGSAVSGGGGGGAPGGGVLPVDPPVTAPPSGPSLTAAPDEPTATTPPAERRQIRDASVDLRLEQAEDLGEVADAVAGTAVAAGGEVADDDRTFGPSPSATLVLRVPPQEVEAVVAAIRGLATVTTSSIDTQDVTEAYTDLETRIATLRRSIERIQGLITDADDVVQIASLEDELQNRETELESLEGQLRVLTDQTARATVTVTIAPPLDAPPPPVEEQGAPPVHPPATADALGNGWSAFTTSASWAAAVVLTVLPFLVTLVVAAVIARLVRRLRHRHRPATA